MLDEEDTQFFIEISESPRSINKDTDKTPVFGRSPAPPQLYPPTPLYPPPPLSLSVASDEDEDIDVPIIVSNQQLQSDSNSDIQEKVEKVEIKEAEDRIDENENPLLSVSLPSRRKLTPNLPIPEVAPAAVGSIAKSMVTFKTNVKRSNDFSYQNIKMKYMRTLKIPVEEKPQTKSSPKRRERSVSVPCVAQSMPLTVPLGDKKGDWKIGQSYYGQFIPPHEMVKHTDTFSVWQYERRKLAADNAL